MNRSILVVFIVCLLGGTTIAAVPSSITVQGRLTDAGGAPLPPGGKTFTFRILDDSTGGTEVWPGGGGEVQTITSDAAGLWIGLIGAISPLTDAVFADNLLWLEINVNGTTLPRIQFLSGPYAFRVATVDGASGGHITSKVSIGPGNTNTGNQAFVAGDLNSASGDHAVISGGQSNAAPGAFAALLGGQHNWASGDHSFIGGGGGPNQSDSNVASGEASVVVGGHGNRASSPQAFIGGGSFNEVSGSGNSANIVGGQSNDVSGLLASVVGGRSNKARGSMSFVGGGGQSNATPGDSNVASGNASAIVCGIGNSATDSGAFVGAGRGNDATGKFAVIPGGLSNAASGRLSFAAGLRAKSHHTGAFVWADATDADFASSANNQFLIRAGGGVGIGTNAPEGPLHVLETSVAGATANVASTGIFERNSANYISILGLDGSPKGILFGDGTDAEHGGIIFDDVALDGLEFRTGGNVTRMTLSSAGDLTVTGCVDGNNTACASDGRFKKDIQPLEDALGTIEKLRGVSYAWRRDEFPDQNFEDGRHMGLIAQQTQDVVPEAVHKRDDGYLSIEYNSFVPLLIEAIKEQQKQIDELKATIQSMTP